MKTRSWQRCDASTDEETQDNPSTGTHSVHPRSIEEQQGTGHNEEDRDLASASRLGPYGHEKRLSPGGESIGGRIVHAVNKNTRNTYDPMT